MAGSLARVLSLALPQTRIAGGYHIQAAVTLVGKRCFPESLGHHGVLFVSVVCVGQAIIPRHMTVSQDSCGSYLLLPGSFKGERGIK